MDTSTPFKWRFQSEGILLWVRWYQQDGLAGLLVCQHGDVRRRRL